MSFGTSASGEPAAEGRVPLVILSGFLGAGKTTLLNHLLHNAKGRRIAVVVNDLGETNIDASLLRDDQVTLRAGGASGVVELTNGCICCAIQSELSEALLMLAETKRPDCVIVESSGVAEPKQILQSLRTIGARRRKPLDVFRIQNLVTVVDAGWLGKELQALYRPVARRSFLLHSDPRRPLSELLMEQVEYADLIVLNKADLASEEELTRLRAVLEAVSPAAEVVVSSEGRVEADSLLEVARFERNEAPGGRREPATQGDGHARPHGSFGIDAFTYRSRRPFRKGVLLDALRRGFPGLLRAKGYFWTTDKLDRVGFLSLSGSVLRADHLGKWMHARLQEGRIDRSQIPAEVWRKWDDEVGDRRQEIVFIGIDLDEAEVRAKLDALLDEQ